MQPCWRQGCCYWDLCHSSSVSLSCTVHTWVGTASMIQQCLAQYGHSRRVDASCLCTVSHQAACSLAADPGFRYSVLIRSWTLSSSALLLCGVSTWDLNFSTSALIQNLDLKMRSWAALPSSLSAFLAYSFWAIRALRACTPICINSSELSYFYYIWWEGKNSKNKEINKKKNTAATTKPHRHRRVGFSGVSCWYVAFQTSLLAQL